MVFVGSVLLVKFLSFTSTIEPKIGGVYQDVAVNFLHVPKTAGTSFYKETANKLLKFSARSPGDNERCFYYKRKKDHLPMVTFLRDPVDHVISQYKMCRYSDWGQKVSNGHFSEDKSFSDGLSNWVRWFLDGHIDSFGCYYPYNMQTRMLTCHERLGHFHIPTVDYDVDEALENLFSMRAFGITEYYKESLCLIFHKLKGDIFEWCFCNSKEHHRNQKVTHGVPEITPQNIDRTLVKKMVEIDTQLYRTAVGKFLEELRAVESKYGRKILC